jgi:1-aminocyclopropane-1-carboxylate deaminase
MLTGFKAQDRPRRLIGVDTIADQETAHAAVLKCARQTAETIGLNDPIDDEDAVVDGRFAGPSYGVPNEETIAAIRMGAELEAMITDPVYEGKSLAGLIAMAREGAFAPGSPVLYVHLGGTPALHAYYRAFD